MSTGRTSLIVILLALVATACSGGGTSRPPDKLTLVSHDSFADAVTDQTFAAFTDQTGISIEVKAAGDAGSMVNQTILTKDNPLGDVLFGIDNTFLSRGLDEGLFVPYQHQTDVNLVPGLDLDPQHRVTPIDYGDVCVNYDIGWFDDKGLAPPETLADLAKPAYSGMLVVEDPASSSPGLAFLMATIDRYGNDWPNFWQSLVDNGVGVVADWDTAYYTDFTRYGGDYPLVVSYASSPPAEVMFADPPVDTAPTAVMTDGCFRQIEFAGILANTDYPDAGGRLIDFMLSADFQQQIPTNWFVFPANADVELPQVFAQNTVIPDHPASLDPSVIDQNREEWINQWHQVVTP
jgi:thiamine transport system substrate-binding protein